MIGCENTEDEAGFYRLFNPGLTRNGTSIPGTAYNKRSKPDGCSQLPTTHGFTIDDGGTWRGFVYDPKDESFEDFLPNPVRTIAQGINSRGQVAGGTGYVDRFVDDRDGFVRESDNSTRLFRVNIDGDRYATRARGISAIGTIVGVYTTDDTGLNGYVGRLPKDPDDQDLIPAAVFTPDNMSECDAGVFLTRINNKGVISGICYGNDGSERGLLLTPVPEGKK